MAATTIGTIRRTPAQFDRAFALVRERVDAGLFPQAEMLVADGERVIRHEAYAPHGREAPANGVYLLASISKVLTATGFLRLVEDGRLLVADPVAKVVPEFAATYREKEAVTFWHLLTHSSGLDEQTAAVEADTRPEGLAGEPWTPERAVALACRAPLLFRPGSQFSYCTASFWLLAEAMRRLGGLSYRDYLARHVFTPLGMTDTGFAPNPAAQAEGRVAPVHGFYLPGVGLEHFTRAGLPGAGVWSTASDLLALGQALLDGGRGRDGYRVLSPAMIAAMSRPQTPGLRPPGQLADADFGLGWMVPPASGNLLATPGSFGHDGATGTLFWIDPAQQIVTILLVNRWDSDLSWRRQILNIVYSCL
jgi:CubicO group peptidase (beta-lactamase class C family)